MTYVLTAPEMQAADAAAMARVGEDALMQRAGSAVADAVREYFPEGARVTALAGPGNNGGDAFAALAELESRYERTVYAAASRSASPARARAERRARDAGVRVEAFPEDDAAVSAALGEGGAAVDALFGTGARLPLPEAYRAAARGLDGRSRFVLAVDVASGIDASDRRGRTGLRLCDRHGRARGGEGRIAARRRSRAQRHRAARGYRNRRFRARPPATGRLPRSTTASCARCCRFARPTPTSAARGPH